MRTNMNRGNGCGFRLLAIFPQSFSQHLSLSPFFVCGTGTCAPFCHFPRLRATRFTSWLHHLAALTHPFGPSFFPKVNGKPVPRGVAFPVCISINNCVCHFSPLGSDDDVTLAKGDVVKM